MRTEFDVYASLEDKFSNNKPFSEGYTSDEWLVKLWQQTQAIAAKHGDTLPDWDTFISGDIIALTDPQPEQVLLADFRQDPDTHKLPTPSGKIELYSQVIAGFNYEDCPPQATWIPPRGVSDGLSKKYKLHLISGQPTTRLHSQLDNGDYSKAAKINGREPVKINPLDAESRGISNGDIVELYNDYGRCLAGAVITDEIKPGVVFLWTGAWYNPDFSAPQHRDTHGNPNVLTHDLRTSALSQGPAAHSAFVEVKRFTDELPGITVHDQPDFVIPAF